MKSGANPALSTAEERQSATVTPIRTFTLEPDPAIEARTRLIGQLAADRLRDLRDDGVSTAYIARMYGVGPSTIQEMMSTITGIR
jgi:DNA invertase Pin-like site-specific DNA recombinase